MASIQFNTSGGAFDNTFNEHNYKNITVVPSLPIPLREGYIFEGWYTDKLKRKKFKLSFGDFLEDDILLYAKWNKKKSNVKVQPQVNEKYNITLQFLESAFINGNDVIITQVDNYELTELAGEKFTYKEPFNAYIIYDERPSVYLLKNLGWYREGNENPSIAYISTHVLKDKRTGEIIWGEVIDGQDYQLLVKQGESQNYKLEPIKIIRGTLIDVFYDFLPESRNRFYVTEVKVDTVSINYIVSLKPYKHIVGPEYEDKEAVEQNPSNHKYLDFDSDKF